MDAWCDSRGQQHRPQWAITQSEVDEDWQANNMQQKPHPDGTNNDRIVPKRADCEKHWTSRRHVCKQKPS